MPASTADTSSRPPSEESKSRQRPTTPRFTTTLTATTTTPRTKIGQDERHITCCKTRHKITPTRPCDPSDKQPHHPRGETAAQSTTHANMTTDNETLRLGRRVAELRKSHGISQRKLAMLADVTQSQVVNIERGKYSPSVKTLSKILMALGFRLGIVPMN